MIVAIALQERHDSALNLVSFGLDGNHWPDLNQVCQCQEVSNKWVSFGWAAPDDISTGRRALGAVARQSPEPAADFSVAEAEGFAVEFTEGAAERD